LGFGEEAERVIFAPLLPAQTRARVRRAKQLLDKILRELTVLPGGDSGRVSW